MQELDYEGMYAFDMLDCTAQSDCMSIDSTLNLPLIVESETGHASSLTELHACVHCTATYGTAVWDKAVRACSGTVSERLLLDLGTDTPERRAAGLRRALVFDAVVPGAFPKTLRAAVRSGLKFSARVGHDSKCYRCREDLPTDPYKRIIGTDSVWSDGIALSGLRALVGIMDGSSGQYAETIKRVANGMMLEILQRHSDRM